MTFKEKLQRPSALVLQGFVAGGILFFATHSVDARPLPAAALVATPVAPIAR